MEVLQAYCSEYFGVTIENQVIFDDEGPICCTTDLRRSLRRVEPFLFLRDTNAMDPPIRLKEFSSKFWWFEQFSTIFSNFQQFFSNFAAIAAIFSNFQQFFSKSTSKFGFCVSVRMLPHTGIDFEKFWKMGSMQNGELWYLTARNFDFGQFLIKFWIFQKNCQILSISSNFDQILTILWSKSKFWIARVKDLKFWFSSNFDFRQILNFVKFWIFQIFTNFVSKKFFLSQILWVLGRKWTSRTPTSSRPARPRRRNSAHHPPRPPHSRKGATWERLRCRANPSCPADTSPFTAKPTWLRIIR